MLAGNRHDSTTVEDMLKALDQRVGLQTGQTVVVDRGMSGEENLDGSYLFKTDRHDLSPDEIWRIYILLTRADAAFRTLKNPLAERPIHHHKQERVEAHIFIYQWTVRKSAEVRLTPDTADLQSCRY